MDEKIWIDASVVLKAIEDYGAEKERRADEFSELNEVASKSFEKLRKTEEEYRAKIRKAAVKLLYGYHRRVVYGSYQDPEPHIEKLKQLCADSSDGKLFIGADTTDFIRKLKTSLNQYVLYMNEQILVNEREIDRLRAEIDDVVTEPNHKIEHDEPVSIPNDTGAGIGPLLLVAAVVILGVVFMFSVSG